MSENRRRRPQQPVQPVAAPRKKKKHNKSLKGYLTILAMMAIVATISIGGTLAWLQDSTTEVTNTFTTSNIDIELKEHPLQADGTLDTSAAEVTANSYKMIPGSTNPKDPFVRVKANSEASWLFVKVEELNGIYDTTDAEGNQTKTQFSDYLTYEIAEGWTLVSDTTNVYARKHDATGSDDATPVYILKNNQVKISEDITKEMMQLITTGNEPKLQFTAYAIQQANIEDNAATAWSKLNGN